MQVIILTERALYRIQASKLAVLSGGLLDTFALSDITNTRWRPRDGGNAGRLSFQTAGRRKLYASKWAAAAELATALPND